MKFSEDNEDIIKTTNLGDSGYMILRPHINKPAYMEVIFKSEEQQEAFNFPY